MGATTSWMSSSSYFWYDWADPFVEGSGEVAFEQLVVIDGLGNDPSGELEVAQMVGVDVLGLKISLEMMTYHSPIILQHRVPPRLNKLKVYKLSTFFNFTLKNNHCFQ